ncbi:MAG: glycosyltransferase family 4 protein [Ardenticatenaceae bacterium]|nr:glycosyltransferase family 4 protein [Ardenticatenaceae bacterium]
MNDVLLTVSGNIPADIEEQIAAGKRPLTDYIAMARTFKADLIDYQKAQQQSGRIGRLIQKIAGNNALLAWACYKKRRQYRVIFTDGEQIAIPLALLLKFASFGQRARHLAIGHILSVGKKMLFFDWLKIQSHIDIFFVYATWQKQFIQDRWHVPPERVVFTPFMVDDHFFSPEQAGETQPALRASLDKQMPIICAVGLEFRDYPTLLKAVDGLNVHLVAAAASPWSKRADTTADQTIPPNVTVQRFTQFELRDLYDMSQFLVMPLYNVEFQAGVTALLEAMSMGKAVICSSTPGQTDVVVADETGIYVPPGNVQAMRQAIQHLLQHPELAQEMGRNGRSRIENYMSLTHYVERLNRYVNP